MAVAPCKDCEKKGCGAYHSQCTAYLEYRKECIEISHKKYAEMRKVRKYRKRLPEQVMLKNLKEERRCGGT